MSFAIRVGDDVINEYFGEPGTLEDLKRVADKRGDNILLTSFGEGPDGGWVTLSLSGQSVLVMGDGPEFERVARRLPYFAGEPAHPC